MQRTQEKGEPKRTKPVEDDDAPPRSPESRPTAWSLSAAAVALATVAVILAIFLPGPPSTVMARRSHGGIATIGASCTTYVGAEVTIRAPGPGTIIVRATVGVGINHTFGVSDTARVVIGTSPTDCDLNNYTAFVSIPWSLPTETVHYVTVPIQRAVPVSGAGTFTFYVNAVMDTGASALDRFDSASVVAVFYPS